MKKALSYLLLVAYLLMLIKPVLPYVSDFVAHTFYKYEHIATVHKENGKTHIHFELQQAAKETGAKKNSLPTKADKYEVMVHIHSDRVFQFTALAIRQSHRCSNTLYHPAFSIAGHYPPPKAV